MNKDFLRFKMSEYYGRAGAAICRDKNERARRAIKMLLVLYRLQARAAVKEVVQATEAYHTAKRSLKKLEEQGIGFPLGEERVKALEDTLHEAQSALADLGRGIAATLDLWQTFGATLADLCNLCNRDYEQVLKEIKPERVDREFSALIFVYDLDYKDPSGRGWIDFDVDAPFTHAVKEHFLDQMIHTPEGRAVSHCAMEACFPGIMEGALTEVVDADGVRRLIDKDGVEVAALGEEEVEQ